MLEVQIDEDGFYSATDVVDGEIFAGYGDTYDEAVQDLKDAVQGFQDEVADEVVEDNESEEDTVEEAEYQANLTADREHFGYDAENGSLAIPADEIEIEVLIRAKVTLADGTEITGEGTTFLDAKDSLSDNLAEWLEA
jgi:hypothetical protein